MNRVGLLHLFLAGWLAAVATPGPASADLAAMRAADPVDAESRTGAPPDGNAGAQAMAPLLTEADRGIYAEAFRLAAAGRFDQARRHAGTAGDQELAKVVLWLDLSDARPAGSFPIIATFLAKNPRWPGRGALQHHAEMVMPADLTDSQVLAWFESHAALTAEGAMRHAEALIRAGEEDRATTLLRATWVERIVSDADEAAFLARHRGLIRREDDLARLDRLLWDRQERTARRQARRLGAGYVALAEARLALARDRPGVDAAVERVPAGLAKDTGLVFERARWRQRRGRYDAVIELLDPPGATAVNPERWWPLRNWAVRQALLKGDISVAYRIAAGNGMDAGLGFAEAEWLAGWIALRFLDQPRAAYRHFIRLHEGVWSPISLGRGAFWAGEAAGALHKREPDAGWNAQSRTWYEISTAHDTSFYGQLAGRRLGREPIVDLSARGAPDDAARAAFDADEIARIVRMLGEIGEVDLQRRFLVRLEGLAETAEDYGLVAGLAEAVGRPDLATRTARVARGEGIILPGYLFPTMALPDAEPPERALLLALIRQESGFYTEAVSPTGARGLMQIMPGTARQVAHRIQIAYNGERLLSDPDYNVRLGSAYLGNLLERYDGSYVLALAAYNAGPARVRQWVGAFGDPRDPAVDVVDWIESIPFDETRNYVQRVLESLVAYRQQLAGSASLAAGLLDVSPIDELPAPVSPSGDVSCCL